MKKILLMIIGLFLMNLAKSQTESLMLLGSSGNSFNNTTYQLDWSIGECVTATYNTGSYIITQGFHQSSYEITTIEEAPSSSLNINVYPNPATNFITVNTEGMTGVQNLLDITLTDINGKIL